MLPYKNSSLALVSSVGDTRGPIRHVKLSRVLRQTRVRREQQPFNVINLKSLTLFSSLSNFSYQAFRTVCFSLLLHWPLFQVCLLSDRTRASRSVMGQKEGALREILATNPLPKVLNILQHLCFRHELGELCCYFTKWSDTSFSFAEP